VDNEASDSATVIEVRAKDEVGLLHRLTRTLYEADLDLVSARVSTLGELVVDVFYVRESGGGKVTDGGRLEEVTTAIWASLRA
jgi:[protein-PII] uridylyltransferase